MIYVMGDIHGCKKAYLEAIEKIKLSQYDTLYVLGDVVDKGNEGIEILQDMMMRANVVPLIGNHDYMALTMLRKLNVPITEENVETYLSVEDMTDFLNWQRDGGKGTFEAFRRLNAEEKKDVLEYLEEFSLYEEVEADGREYVLVHSSLEPFDPYIKEYLKDRIVITSRFNEENQTSDSENYLMVMCLDDGRTWKISNE